MRWWGYIAGASLVACSAGGSTGDTDTPMLGETGTASSAGPGSGPGEGPGSDDGSDADTATSVTPPGETSTGDDGSDTDIPDGCQNSVLDPGEECDDGNDVNADGCNRDCRLSASLVWSTSHGAGVGMIDQGFGVITAVDGSSIVSGYVSDAADSRNGWIRRYDGNGVAMWTHSLAGVGGGNDEIRGLIGDAGGNIYAAGYESGPMGEGLNAWLRKYDGAGTELWTRTYNGPNSSTDVYDGVAIDADGDVIVAGYHNVAGEAADVFLRKYSPDGDVLWTRSTTGPNGDNDILWDVEPSPAGHLYVVGYEQGPDGEARNTYLAKYDGDGNVVWTRTYNGPDSLDDYLTGVEVVGDDDVVVCGYESAVDYPWRVSVRRYDSLGMLVWSDDWAGATEEGAHCFGVRVDGDGNIVTTGGEIENRVRGVMVRKYDPDGEVLWSIVIPGGAAGPDYGREIAIGDGEEIHVTGSLDSGADARDIWLGVITP